MLPLDRAAEAFVSQKQIVRVWRSRQRRYGRSWVLRRQNSNSWGRAWRAWRLSKMKKLQRRLEIRKGMRCKMIGMFWWFIKDSGPKLLVRNQAFWQSTNCRYPTRELPPELFWIPKSFLRLFGLSMFLSSIQSPNVEEDFQLSVWKLLPPQSL